VLEAGLTPLSPKRRRKRSRSRSRSSSPKRSRSQSSRLSRNMRRRCGAPAGFAQLVGSRVQVWNGTAYKTAGGLCKGDMVRNKHGRLVSKKKQAGGRRLRKSLSPRKRKQLDEMLAKHAFQPGHSGRRSKSRKK
jgi:hypothetical protein